MSDFVTEGYWRQIQGLMQEKDALQKEVARLKKCEQFVQDFVKLGFRIDTMPTRMFMTKTSPEAMQAQSDEYMWWNAYVSGAEKRLMDCARRALQEENANGMEQR